MKIYKKGYRFNPLNWTPLNHLIGKIIYRKMISELKKKGLWDKLEVMMVSGYWIKL